MVPGGRIRGGDEPAAAGEPTGDVDASNVGLNPLGPDQGAAAEVAREPEEVGVECDQGVAGEE